MLSFLLQSSDAHALMGVTFIRDFRSIRVSNYLKLSILSQTKESDSYSQANFSYSASVTADCVYLQQKSFITIHLLTRVAKK